MADKVGSELGVSRLLPVAAVQAWPDHTPADQAEIAMGLRDWWFHLRLKQKNAFCGAACRTRTPAAAAR